MNLENFKKRFEMFVRINSLNSLNTKFEEFLKTLLTIIGRKIEISFPPQCERENGTMKIFLVLALVLQTFTLGVSLALMSLRISPFIILCENNENLNNRRYLKGSKFNGLSTVC